MKRVTGVDIGNAKVPVGRNGRPVMVAGSKEKSVADGKLVL